MIFLIFVYVIPILLATNSPVDLLRGELNYQNLFYFILYNLLGFIVIRIQWKRGLKRYTSAN
ncbi:ABC-2 family transporter protein [Bacillus chungangensis]|uniref:ABC-2 family transporter protein n=1 Tax=Bacillus chungangensis TaxID=587633 RepID=UPI003522A86B